MASTQKEILSKLVADVETLKAELDSLKNPAIGVPKFVADTAPKVEEKPVSVPFPDYPVPPEYKDIVHLTFNRSFEVRLEPMKETPAFLFTIVVPPKYSKVTSGEDLRVKVITYSDGVSGVRLWADKVWNNLDSDTQGRIITDRPFVEAKI